MSHLPAKQYCTKTFEFVQLYHLMTVSESLHRLCYQRKAFYALHAPKPPDAPVPTVALRRLALVRVHSPGHDRAQHCGPHDEGNYTASLKHGPVQAAASGRPSGGNQAESYLASLKYGIVWDKNYNVQCLRTVFFNMLFL